MEEMIMEYDYLQHHGILGQKWGVRRYQNPDGTLTAEGKKRLDVGKRATSVSQKSKREQDKWRRKAMRQHSGVETPKFTNTETLNPDEAYVKKKGETVNHLTIADKITPREGVLYVSATDEDQMLYKSVLAARIMKHCKTKTINSIDIELKEDLKAPSRKESISLFYDYYNDNKNQVDEYLRNRSKQIVKILEDDNEEKSVIKEWTNIRDRITTGSKSAIENYGYRIFNHDFTEKDILSNPVFKGYVDVLKTKGYNALIDDNDSKYNHMGAKVPIAILDPLGVIGNMTVEELHADSVYSRYMDWLEAEMRKTN